MLVSPLRTNRRNRNNLVSDSRADASAAMATDSRPPDAQKDLASSDAFADTLHIILAQLATINKCLELQSEAPARHDQLLGSQIGMAVSTPNPAKPVEMNGQASVTTGTCGGSNGNGGEGFRQPSRSQHRHNGGDLREELCNSFHRPKLKFPRYDGETDPLPWLNRCESYFKGMRTMAAEQVWLASLHLDGAAAEWYYSLEREYGMLPWTRFAQFVNPRFGLAQFVNLCFGPPIRFNPLGELKALQKIGMVEEYQRHILMLLCRCDGLSPDHQMNLFTAGLGEPLTSDVEMQRPNDLQVVISLAKAFERRASAASPASALVSARVSYYPRPTVSATGSTATSTPAAPTNSLKSRFRRLSPEEMTNKRK
jgi:hypothetical protein